MAVRIQNPIFEMLNTVSHSSRHGNAVPPPLVTMVPPPHDNTMPPPLTQRIPPMAGDATIPLRSYQPATPSRRLPAEDSMIASWRMALLALAVTAAPLSAQSEAELKQYFEG